MRLVLNFHSLIVDYYDVYLTGGARNLHDILLGHHVGNNHTVHGVNLDSVAFGYTFNRDAVAVVGNSNLLAGYVDNTRSLNGLYFVSVLVCGNKLGAALTVDMLSEKLQKI